VFCLNEPVKKSRLKRNINIFLCWIFIINAFFLPHDTLFELKKISLILLLVMNLSCIFSCSSNRNKLIFMFGFGLTSFSILYSIVLTGEIFGNISSGYVGYILLLEPILLYYKIDFEKIFICTMKIMAYFIVIMGLLHLFGILNVYKNPVLLWLNYTENAKINPVSQTFIGFAIFLLASPVLLVVLPHFIQKKKWVDVMVVLVAILFSGTRANVLSGIAVLVISIIFIKKDANQKVLVGILLLSFMVLVLSEGSILSYFISWFERKASSDNIRSLTLKSIFLYWEQHPFSLITGTGFASEFYDIGRKEWTSNAELSYWILLRRMGIPIFIFFMVMFFYPFLKTFKLKLSNLYWIGYVFYLLIAYTNPLLYGSTGMTVLLFMYYVCQSYYPLGDDDKFRRKRNRIKFLVK